VLGPEMSPQRIGLSKSFADSLLVLRVRTIDFGIWKREKKVLKFFISTRLHVGTIGSNEIPLA